METDIKKLLGQRIRLLRKRREFTQEQLSELIGIEPLSLSRIECGSRFPRKENIEKLAQALDCTINDLFNFKEEKTYTAAELRKEINQKLKMASINDLKYFNKIITAYWDTKI